MAYNKRTRQNFANQDARNATVLLEKTSLLLAYDHNIIPIFLISPSLAGSSHVFLKERESS